MQLIFLCFFWSDRLFRYVLFIFLAIKWVNEIMEWGKMQIWPRNRLVFKIALFFPRASERRVLPIVEVCKTSSPLHIFSSSHLPIFTSSHLHIFTSSHLHILSSSYPHIFTAAHLIILRSFHLLIFTSSHLHIFSSSHLLLLPSCPLALFLPSCPLVLSFFSISLLKARGSANETARNATLSHEMKFDRQKLK